MFALASLALGCFAPGLHAQRTDVRVERSEPLVPVCTSPIELHPDAKGRIEIPDVLDAYCRSFGGCWTADRDSAKLLEYVPIALSGAPQTVHVPTARVQRFVGELLLGAGLATTRVSAPGCTLLVLHATHGVDAYATAGGPLLVREDELPQAALFGAQQVACVVDADLQHPTRFIENLGLWAWSDGVTLLRPLGTSLLMVGSARDVQRMDSLLALCPRADPAARRDTPPPRVSAELPAKSELHVEDVFLARITGTPSLGHDVQALVAALDAGCKQPIVVSDRMRELAATVNFSIRPATEIPVAAMSAIGEELLLANQWMLDVARETDGSARLVLHAWTGGATFSPEGAYPYVRVEELGAWSAHPALRVSTLVRVPHLDAEATCGYLLLFFYRGERAALSSCKPWRGTDALEIHGPIEVVAGVVEWLRQAEEWNAKRLGGG